MARPLRVAILGWSCGFALALLAGARQANSPTLATVLLAAALTSMAAVAVLLVATMVHDRREARAEVSATEAAEAPAQLAEPDPAVTATRPAPRPKPEGTRAPKPTASDAAAARVAELEARLAEEQRELEAVAAALAAADEKAGVAPERPEPEDDPAAIDAEPVLRRELLDTVTSLVGSGTTGATARDLEDLLRSRR